MSEPVAAAGPAVGFAGQIDPLNGAGHVVAPAFDVEQFCEAAARSALIESKRLVVACESRQRAGGNNSILPDVVRRRRWRAGNGVQLRAGVQVVADSLDVDRAV